MCRIVSPSVGNNFGQIFRDATVVYFVQSSEFRKLPLIWKWLPACFSIQRFFEVIFGRPVSIRAAHNWTFLICPLRYDWSETTAAYSRRGTMKAVYIFERVFLPRLNLSLFRRPNCLYALFSNTLIFYWEKKQHLYIWKYKLCPRYHLSVFCWIFLSTFSKVVWITYAMSYFIFRHRRKVYSLAFRFNFIGFQI